MALSHLRSAGIAWAEDIPAVAACPDDERRVLAHQLDTGLGCVPTSSMGRLFDAVSSVLGVRHTIDFEAEAAIELESLARAHGPAAPYAFGVWQSDGCMVADPGPVIRAVVEDLRAGAGPGVVAARFHAAVAALVGELASLAREESGLDVVALGGGVFGNAVLLEAATRVLDARGFRVLRPRLLPPNDGGIALGQILVGSAS